MVMSIVGLVVIVAVVGVGAYWLIKNVNFKQTEKDKEDTK